MISSLLIDIGIIILAAAILALVTKFLKQPIVVGYVIAGLLIGPLVWSFVSNTELIKQLSELGIAFLLFIVGLELDLNKFKQLGAVVTVTGILQVALVTIVAAYFAGFWLTPIEALYIGLIVAFSSTMIVVKLISDKAELDTLHGKIILGILLVQDILVVIALSLLQSLGSTSFLTILSLVKGLALICVSYLVGRYVLSYILRASASLPELLFVVSIAIAFLYSALAYYLGFSIVIGAFIAGVALASSPYSVEIVGRVISLKDFFLVIFFVALGMQITSFSFDGSTNFLLTLLFLVVVVKPLIVFGLLKMFKQSNRTSFSSSVSLAQISEFSLVLAATGVALGHLGNNIFSLVIILGAITITLASYLIKYDRNIYGAIHPFLLRIETSPKYFGMEKLEKPMKNHIVIIGAHRMASKIIEALKSKKKNFVVLDFNPDRVRELNKRGVKCVYGDYGNLHVLESVHIADAKIVISTVPNLHDNIRLIKLSKKTNKDVILIIKTHSAFDALMLYREGADFVIFPEYLSGQKVADYLVHLDSKGIRKWGKHYRIKLVDEIRENRLFM